MRRHRLVARALCAAASLSLAAAAAAAILEGAASGTLTVGGETTPLRYAYARAEKGFFDPSKEDTRLILSDVPLSEQALTDEFRRNHMAQDGKLHSVEVVIDAQRRPIAGVLRHAAFSKTQAFVSVSGMHTFEPKTFDGRFVEGRLSTERPGEFMDVTFEYAATFRAPVWHPPASTAVGAAARETPAAKVVLAFLKAARAGDRAAMKKLMTTEAAKELDGPRGAEMLEFLKSTSPDPASAEIESVNVQGNVAEVAVTEKSKDESETSRMKLVREGGQWRVGQ
jgi:hypothetical protein